MTHHTHIHLTSQDLKRLESLVASVRKSENVLALEEQL
jgi:hypothetical protein